MTNITHNDNAKISNVQFGNHQSVYGTYVGSEIEFDLTYTDESNERKITHLKGYKHYHTDNFVDTGKKIVLKHDGKFIPVSEKNLCDQAWKHQFSLALA